MHPRAVPLEVALPPIPAKRYFTIGEVSELCAVKPHVLRYWEQEFTQLRPMKRRGNRRYYQHHEVLLVRRIRELLYEQGFTISGARNRLVEGVRRGRSAEAGAGRAPAEAAASADGLEALAAGWSARAGSPGGAGPNDRAGPCGQPVTPGQAAVMAGAGNAASDPVGRAPASFAAAASDRTGPPDSQAKRTVLDCAAQAALRRDLLDALELLR